MELKGTVEDIIFRNDENGYSVIVLDVDGSPITAVGSFPVLAEGETIVVEGEYKDNPKYGKQFSVTKMDTTAPDGPEGMVRFLSSGLIKGVGEVTARNLVTHFGKDTMTVIEQKPTLLAHVRGISQKKAAEIHESFMEIKSMRDAVMFLQQYGISPLMSVRIFNQYGERTEQRVRDNPYRLIEDVDGIGFLTADKIASNMGISGDSKFRLRAGLQHALKDAAEKSGHTYLPLEELTDTVNGLLGLMKISQEIMTECAELSVLGLMKLIKQEDGNAVMLSRYYSLERGVAGKLITLNEAAELPVKNAARLIADYETVHGVEFHQAQRDAIALALSNGVTVITGGPGTGKTTITKCILEIVKIHGMRPLLLAPTGRAAKRMTEATGLEASTIHRALQSEFEAGRFARNEANPLDATFIVVDEVSMVDAFLMHHLLAAIRPGTRLLLVGDKDQLPSVGAGNVLSDILSSGVIANLALTQIYRQAEKSLIVTNAHRINRGEMPVLTDRSASSDFFFLERNDAVDIARTVLEMVTTRLPKFLDIDSAKIQILSPVKNGEAGVYKLNKLAQQALNPRTAQSGEVQFGDVVFRKHDKVMHVVNDYDLEWRRYDGMRVIEGSGVFNGDIGYVTDILAASKELEVTYEDGRVARYGADRLEELMLAYAITVHKSQGCEFDAVVMPLVGGSPQILTRNLLYTGITRAKRMVVLIGSAYHLQRMIDNNFTQRRYSRLQELLIEHRKKLGSLVGIR